VNCTISSNRSAGQHTIQPAIPPVTEHFGERAAQREFQCLYAHQLGLELNFSYHEGKGGPREAGVDKRTGVRRATAWNVAESRVAREEEKKSFELAQGNDGFVDLSKYRELG